MCKCGDGDKPHCGCPAGGEHTTKCPTMLGDIARMNRVASLCADIDALRECFKDCAPLDRTPCPDCGACPRETRCDCDHAGIRVRREMDALRQRLAVAETDTRRLDAMERNGWDVSKNVRAGGWIVQRTMQVVGNIGHGKTLRAAIDAAEGGGK